MVFVYGGKLKTQRDRQWELIQQLLSSDLMSAPTPKFTSQRTLFGIKSSTEELLDRVVAEENQRIERQLHNEQHTVNTDNTLDKSTMCHECDSNDDCDKKA